MKRILYDMGLLALVRWLLQSAFKFEPPFGPGSELKRVLPTQKLKKNKCVLKRFLGKIQCFKPMLFIFFLSGKSAFADFPCLLRHVHFVSIEATFVRQG